MSEEPNADRINRRSFVKGLGATTGGAALTSVGIGSATAQSQNGAKKLTGGESNSISNNIKDSNSFEKYQKYFRKDNVDIDKNNPDVYEIIDNGEDDAQVVSFEIQYHSDKEEHGDITFKIQNNSLVDHGATTQHWKSDTSYQLNRLTATDDGITSETLDVDITKSKSGEREQVEMIRNPGTENERRATSVSGLSQRPSTSVAVGCGACKSVFKALCQVGCSANIGVICLVASGGIGSIVCGAAATLICSWIAVPNNCNMSELPVGSREGACRQVGAC